MPDPKASPPSDLASSPRTATTATAAPSTPQTTGIGPHGTGGTQQVVVTGQPLGGTAAVDPEALKPRPDRPDPSRPGETRPGGAFIAADGKTVIDSEGRPVKGLTVQDGKIVEGGDGGSDATQAAKK